MKWIKRNIITLVLLFLTITGLVIRINLVSKGDFWLDEAFTGIFVRESWKEMYRMIAIDFVHPPLYYSLVKIWTLLFGNTSAITIRLFSILFGSALIPLSYIFMNTLLKKRMKSVSLFTAFVFTINPFLVSYSVEARSYSLLAFIGLITSILFLKILREKTLSLNKHYILFILSSGLLVTTHYISTIFLLCLGISYIVIKKISLSTFKEILYLFIPSVILTITTIGSLYWYRGKLLGYFDFTRGSADWIAPANLTRIPMTIYNFFFGIQAQQMGMLPSNTFSIKSITPEIVSIFLSVLLLLGIGYLIYKRNKISDLFYILSISLLPILFVILLSKIGVEMYIERYMIIFGVGILLLGSYLVHLFAKPISFLLGFVYLILVMLIVPQPHSNKYSEICNAVNGKNLVVDDPSEYILVKYHCDKSHILLYTNNPDFYKTYWLIIGIENTTQVLEPNTYLLKKTNEVESNDIWKDLNNNKDAQFGDISIYRVN